MGKEYDYHKLAALIAAVVTINLLGVNPVFSAQEADPAVSVFNQNCSTCHSIGGGKMIGPVQE